MQSVASMKSSVVKRSVFPAGHKTSVSLEDDFWKALKEISGARHMTQSALIHEIDEQRRQGNLSSAIRLFVLKFYRSQASAKVGDEVLRFQSRPQAGRQPRPSRRSTPLRHRSGRSGP
jgi:predicted DNA-binding ribbon-helix-helix protein